MATDKKTKTHKANRRMLSLQAHCSRRLPLGDVAADIVALKALLSNVVTPSAPAGRSASCANRIGGHQIVNLARIG
jgi:hypothetical protein